MRGSSDPAGWLAYAAENLEVAKASLHGGWLSACLQNTQQATEKPLKAVMISRNCPVRRSHNTRELARDLKQSGCDMGLTDDDCELIDSVYLPSKYPPDSAMPSAMPDRSLCQTCLDIPERALASARSQLERR